MPTVKSLITVWKKLPLSLKFLVAVDLYYLVTFIWNLLFYREYFSKMKPWGVENNIALIVLSILYSFIIVGAFLYAVYTRKGRVFDYYVSFALIFGIISQLIIWIRADKNIFPPWIMIPLELFFFRLVYTQRKYFNK